MRIFVVNSTSNVLNLKDGVIKNPGVDGIMLRLLISNMINSDGSFNVGYINGVKDKIRQWDKPVSIGVMFGGYSGNWFYNHYSWVGFIERGHSGTGPSMAIKVPVLWDPGYIVKVELFLDWLRDHLDEIWDRIDHIKVTGCNMWTAEWRIPDQDFTGVGDPNVNGAQKWLGIGYTVDKFLNASREIMDHVFNAMNDKPVSLPIIGGLTGFPCIGMDGSITLPGKRPDLSKMLIDYGAGAYDKFIAQSNALDETSGTPPAVMNSGAMKIFQVADNKWGNGLKTPYTDVQRQGIQRVIDNGKNHGAEIVEVFEKTVLCYPGIHA